MAQATLANLDDGNQSVTSPKWMRWAGLVVSALPVLMLLMSATMKLMGSQQIVGAFHDKFGYPLSTLAAIGTLELACTVIYLIPRTAILGAVLLTGYLGGAVATHVRIGEAFTAPLVLGMLVWVGLFLRDERVRALLPLRKKA